MLVCGDFSQIILQGNILSTCIGVGVVGGGGSGILSISIPGSPQHNNGRSIFRISLASIYFQFSDKTEVRSLGLLISRPHSGLPYIYSGLFKACLYSGINYVFLKVLL